MFMISTKKKREREKKEEKNSRGREDVKVDVRDVRLSLKISRDNNGLAENEKL